MGNKDLSDLVIKNVHFVLAGYNQSGARARRPTRTVWSIVLKYEGKTVYTWGEKRIVSNLNHPVILPKGCSYDWECTEAGHFSIIEFDADMTLDEPISFTYKSSDKLLRIMKELEHKRNIKSDTVNIESIRDTYSIILSLMQSVDEPYLPSAKQKKIAPAIEYISQNYNRDIRNDTLAELIGVSTVYFRRLFRETIGTSPIAYAHELRIQKAKELLKSDYGSLTDIAQFLGYSSIYDFSRDFKARVGVAPSKYE